jgi:hypothetical protein
MEVSCNRGGPKSSIFKGFSIVNHPFWGNPIYGTPAYFAMANLRYPAKKILAGERR